MTLTRILQLVLGVLLLALFGFVIWWAATCTTERQYADRPAEVIPEEDIDEGLVAEPPSLVERIYIREIAPDREGVAVAGARKEVEKFAEAVKDTSKTRPPEFPPVRGRYDDERLTLAVGRSDGALVRREFECPSPCQFYAADTTIAAQTMRSVPRLFPEVVKTVVVCGAFAAASTAIALAAEYDEPVLVAGVSAAGCTVLKIIL